MLLLYDHNTGNQHISTSEVSSSEWIAQLLTGNTWITNENYSGKLFSVLSLFINTTKEGEYTEM